MTKPEPIAVVNSMGDKIAYLRVGDVPVCLIAKSVAMDKAVAINRAHFLSIAKVLREEADRAHENGCRAFSEGLLRARAAEFEEAGK